MQLRALYNDVSITLPGHGPISATVDSVAAFISVENTHANITPVPSRTLEDLVYSVVNTVKLRAEPILQLRQSDGETFWVPLAELASNTLCINQYRLPSSFPRTQTLCHINASMVPPQPVILVDSPEPTDLLISLGTAPHHDIEVLFPASPRLLLVSGVAGAGKSTLISALRNSMPERLLFPTITSTAPLSWVGPHNKSDLVLLQEFEDLVQVGAFVYVCSLPEEPGVKWGLLRQELVSTTGSLAATSSRGVVSPVSKAFFAVVEEHPVGVLAARSAGVACLVLHVTIPTIDVMDQRLRMSGKCYEEHQVCFSS